MRTKELFYEDSMLHEFDAVVTSCVQDGDGWRVELDQTAFFPNGGGQPGDTGTLGGVRVRDTMRSADGVVHLCAQPLEVGGAVHGRLDFDRRFAFMQQHSAEHLLSGMVHARFGYDNVGFHMGADAVTVDFDGVVDTAQMERLERELNEIVWKDLPIETVFPTEQALAQMQYRSKKELKEKIRIVRCPGVDACACCAMHVQSTGQIGCVKLLSRIGHKKTGTRIQMLAGRPAYDYLSAVCAQNDAVSAALSAKPLETAAAAKRLLQRAADAEYARVALYRQMAALLATQQAGDLLVFAPAMGGALQEFGSELFARSGARAAVFSGAGESWQYMLCTGRADDAVLTGLNAALHGKGGGRDGWMRGAVTASREQIEAYFAGWHAVTLHSS